MKIVHMLIVTALCLAPLTPALAQGCCGGQPMKESCAMAGHDTQSAAGHATHSGHAAPATTPVQQVSGSKPTAALDKPAQAVFTPYFKAQAALAKDSAGDVRAAALEMLKAVQGDSKPAFSPELAAQVEAFAQAKDLAAARTAFKPVSESLIKYLNDNHIAQTAFHQAYCPMAKARWLQTDSTIANPYFGKEMLRCGRFES